MDPLNTLVIANAQLANYCDKVEHCEQADRDAVVDDALYRWRDVGMHLAHYATDVQPNDFWLKVLGWTWTNDYTLPGGVEDWEPGKLSWLDAQGSMNAHDRSNDVMGFGYSAYDRARQLAIQLMTLPPKIQQQPLYVAQNLVRIHLRVATTFRVKLAADVYLPVSFDSFRTAGV